MRTVAWSARASWLTLAAATILLAGCSAGSVGGSVETLAKLDGWRDGPGYEGPFAVLEIAYDDDTAAMLWEDNVGAGQAAHDGLAEVDLSRQIVALYSSGESGSCPESVHDIELDDGTVDIMLTVDTGGGDACSGDYNPYRVVIAIDRADVPTRDELAGTEGTVDGNPALEVVVGEYPVT